MKKMHKIGIAIIATTTWFDGFKSIYQDNQLSFVQVVLMATSLALSFVLFDESEDN